MSGVFSNRSVTRLKVLTTLGEGSGILYDFVGEREIIRKSSGSIGRVPGMNEGSSGGPEVVSESRDIKLCINILIMNYLYFILI